ncbi:transcription factor IIIB 60 kDa subunit-like [Malania oleifera]|uniref:transcription factor IIIB 60 kDa subunit-like n=1 Tax=Malania oleifera TaxID=397392 RepID=UPI0025AE948D|nr:transcription factor IIIB 60 kDa subunit-like [Malania oleifera]
MVWCKFCAKNCPAVRLEDSFLCCGTCGKVVEYDNFSNEPTFVKNAAGQSQLSGNFVRTVRSSFSASRERVMNRARMDMDCMITVLGMGGGDSILNQAMAFYTIAIERNFTKGRRVEQVEAACLYIACRENKKPYLLIDFSEYLKVNVYVLGAVFLQLCKLLSLEEHPIVQKPVDPSLFIHRFTGGLPGGTNMEVSKTALRIIASMKRDWMQTGRKPSGLCGAALYISALSHGLNCSKLDIIKIVHVCEATLTKRLIEFENTESGGLTIEEFNTKAEELELLSAKQASIGSKGSGISEMLCEHKGSGKPSFAHGLCESCYDDFIKLSGGLDGGSEPPAFQRAERERMEKAAAYENATDSGYVLMPSQKQNKNEQFNKSLEKEFDVPNVRESEKLPFAEPKNIGVTTDSATSEGVRGEFHEADGTTNKAWDESESLSDIDDVELDGYLHNEEEKRLKKIIWEEMNKEYLEEQAAKEAAAAAAKEAFEANFRDRPEELQAARELAAAAAAAVAKSRKEKQQKRAAEARNATPAQTAAEATRQMLAKKRLSSKINYDVLEKLFDEPVTPENPKKTRTETPLDEDGNKNSRKRENSEDIYRDGDSGLADEYEDDGYTGRAFADEYEDDGYTGRAYAGDLYEEHVGYDIDNDEY